MNVSTDPNLRLATYGTLRRGQALSGWFDDKAKFQRMPGTGTIDGSLYYHPHGNYPVVVLGTCERTVVEIVSPKNRDGIAEYVDCLEMEESAGYEIQTVTVDTENGAVQALVCAWPYRTVGPRIASNDWTDRAGVAQAPAQTR